MSPVSMSGSGLMARKNAGTAINRDAMTDPEEGAERAAMKGAEGTPADADYEDDVEVTEDDADPEEGAEGAEEGAPTAQEAEQLEQAEKLATVILHGEGESGDRIAAMVMDAKDIGLGIGNAVTAVMLIIEKEMPLNDDMRLVVATEILNMLLELAIEGGALAEDEVTEELIDNAVSHAYSSYLSAKEAMGELDLEHLKATVEEATQTAQAAGMRVPPRAPQNAPQNAPRNTPQPQAPAPGGLMRRA